ncbi:MAG: hypothetical protein RL745_528 [Actinomycetota bacterium]
MTWLKSAAAYLGLVEGSTAKVADLEVDERIETPQVDMPRPQVLPAVTAPASVAGPRVAEISRIVTLEPLNYNDAKRIGEEFRNGVPVIMNLTGMDDEDAKRLIDFAAGLVFAMRGSIERVTTKVFLLSPANVDVGSAARAQMRGDGFFNQS